MIKTKDGRKRKGRGKIVGAVAVQLKMKEGREK
jgi:hypothetical protein